MTPRRRIVPLRALSVVGVTAGLLLGTLPSAGAAAPPGRSGDPVATVLASPSPTTAVTRVTTKPQRTPAYRVVTKRGKGAIRWANNRSTYPTRRCIVFVRTALKVPGRYATPRIAFAHARHRHHSDFAKIPAGVPVFTAGRTAPGHVVLSLGNGKIRSTDWPRAGRVGTVSLARFLRTWNHRYLGWSEDLNGVRVWHR